MINKAFEDEAMSVLKHFNGIKGLVKALTMTLMLDDF
jgi:hypothetical protein